MNKDDYKKVPESVLNCGGLIGKIMDYTLDQSHRPNRELAFAGSLAWIAHLMGRRYRTLSNGRPNLYILGVAWSGVGKSAPRNTNFRLSKACGLMHTVVEDFRSGEALQDAVLQTPKILSQYDEVDTLFNSIKNGKDSVSTNLLGEMMKEWEKSGSFLYRRKLAASVKGRNDDKTPNVCYHPHFSLFATGVTSEVYKSISGKMAINGFFARLLIIDAGQRGVGKDPIYRDIPEDIVRDCKALCGYQEDATLWQELRHDWDGTGIIIREDESAIAFKREFKKEADEHYNVEEDGVENAVWNRTMEKATKVAMCLAGSDNPYNPIITKRHWEFARDLVMYSNTNQVKTLLRYAFESDYQDLQNRIIRRLEKGITCNRALLASLRVKNDDLREAVETLRAAGKIIFCTDKGEELAEYAKGISYALA